MLGPYTSSHISRNHACMYRCVHNISVYIYNIYVYVYPQYFLNWSWTMSHSVVSSLGSLKLKLINLALLTRTLNQLYYTASSVSIPLVLVHTNVEIRGEIWGRALLHLLGNLDNDMVLGSTRKHQIQTQKFLIYWFMRYNNKWQMEVGFVSRYWGTQKPEQFGLNQVAHHITSKSSKNHVAQSPPIIGSYCWIWFGQLVLWIRLNQTQHHWKPPLHCSK